MHVLKEESVMFDYVAINPTIINNNYKSRIELVKVIETIGYHSKKKSR